jgi:hypothetical protein
MVVDQQQSFRFFSVWFKFPPEIAQGMTVILTQPISLTGEWEAVYYDATHNHFLCVREGTLFRFSLNDQDPIPVEIFRHSFITSKFKLVKLSLNRELIAAQISNSAVIVFDLASDKKWKIDIRGNEIVSQGVIWSEHAGNSEDLVIVTNKGLELYKINNKKCYCRISRTLQQPILNYWYNIENRMILIATAKKAMSKNEFAMKTNPSKDAKELLIMDGYFFKFEKPNIPMLELPAPDKIPRFELGPGVEMDCIHLVNVYGKLVTLVRYYQDSEGFFAVYQITKTSIDKLFSLAIGTQLSKDIVLSTYDNLILVHDMKNKNSMIFDIMKTPRERISRASSLTIDPLLPSSVILYTSRFVEEEMAHLKINEERDAQQKKRNGSIRLDPDLALSVGLNASRLSNENHTISPFDQHGVPQIKRPDSIKFVSNLDDDLSGLDDLQFSRKNVNDIKSLRFDYIELDNPTPAYPFYSDAIFEWYDSNIAYDNDGKVIWKIQCKFDFTAKAIDDYREKNLFLSRRGRRYVYNNTVKSFANNSFNNSNNISQESQLAKIALLRLLYESLEEKIDLSHYYPLFYGMFNSYILENYRYFTFRGIRYNTLEDTDLDLVKELKIKYTVNNDSILQQVQQQQQQQQQSQQVGLSPNLSNGNLSSMSGSTSTTNNSSPALSTQSSPGTLLKPIASSSSWRRQSISEKVMQRVNMIRARTSSTASFTGGSGTITNSSYNTDSLIVLDSDAGGGTANLDVDPLEPNYVSVLPAITATSSMICEKIKKQLTANQSAYLEAIKKGLDLPTPPPLALTTTVAANNKKTTSYVSLSSVTPVSNIKIESFPLTTRRDEKGDLVITQTELFYYVWLPVLLSEKIDYSYFAEVFTIYLTSIMDQGIEIIPSLLYLHLQLYFSLNKLTDILNLLQTNFYANCVPVARLLLDFAMILEEDLNNIKSTNNNINANSNDSHLLQLDDDSEKEELMELQETCITTFRNYSGKIFFKSNEYIPVIKGYLMQGKIIPAIELCQQYVISPALMMGSNSDENKIFANNQITSAEFFVATLEQFKRENASSLTHSSPNSNRNSSSNLAIPTTSSKSEGSQQPDMIITATGGDEDNNNITEKIRVLYAVYCFLHVWDRSILERTTVSDKLTVFY